MTAKVFPIIPASAKAMWVMLPIAVFLVVLAFFLGFIAYSTRNAKFEVVEGGLRIKGALYGRFISNGSFVKDGAKILNLDRETDFQPRTRANGIGLPGYSEGWFKLKNGEKALLFLTDRTKVVYIPTKNGYSVLLSPKHPEEMLNWVGELL
ncbi:MAG: hypothetical protein AMJ41_05365 [candidate division Zixibacteria bacterium DG_27]|nr:MAG: hypothetical protein AMJ41_05365 [candidate division Zixibacteria bacterium DG_27]